MSETPESSIAIVAAQTAYSRLWNELGNSPESLINRMDPGFPWAIPEYRDTDSLRKWVSLLHDMVIPLLTPRQQAELTALLSQTIREIQTQRAQDSEKTDRALRLDQLAKGVDAACRAALRSINLNEILECGECFKSALAKGLPTERFSHETVSELQFSLKQTYRQCERSGLNTILKQHYTELQELLSIDRLPACDSELLGFASLQETIEAAKGQLIDFAGDWGISPPETKDSDWHEIAEGGLLISGNILEGAIAMLISGDPGKMCSVLFSVFMGAVKVHAGYYPK